MYAYRQQTEVRTLHAVPQRRVVTPVRPIPKKKVLKKKKNIFVEFFRLMVTLTFLTSYIVFVFPTAYKNLVKPIIFPNSLYTVTDYNTDMKYRDPAYNTDVNLYSIANPTANYLANDIFNNLQMLTPTVVKPHNEVTTMYHTAEMLDLKNQIKTLMSQYPSIKPSIYAWEYEQGRYLDIDSEKIYPAASIIKLPILVRMFKSIEANQFTIYDEMKMIEQYRSSGSGNLQYAPANKTYTMDYLAKVMIQDSDNTSTNMIMAKMGGMNDVNIGLRDWGISKTYVRTWLPDLKGTNKTTAADMDQEAIKFRCESKELDSLLIAHRNPFAIGTHIHSGLRLYKGHGAFIFVRAVFIIQRSYCREILRVLRKKNVVTASSET